MTKFLQTLTDAIAVGGFYALIALGYTMVYGILKFINFAHGDVFMIGAWMSYIIAREAGWTAAAAASPSPWVAVPLTLLGAMAFCVALGLLIERLAYRPLKNAPRLNVLITAIGVSLLLENAGQLPGVFGAQPRRMPSLLPDTVLWEYFGVSLRLIDTLIIFIPLVLMAALDWLVFHTRTGRAMRAVSHNRDVAALMGVPVSRVISITFAIGSALAGAAGFLCALKYPGLSQPASSTWILLGLKAFVAAVVGGIGNIRGAVLGAFFIAAVEMFGSAYLSPQLRDVYVFALLILVLLFKPSGLLGRAEVEKL